MNKLSAIILAGSILMGGMGNALAGEDAGPLAAENFSATLTFTTDYVFRGISFSDSLPALQGSFDWSYGNFFVGAWSSSLADASDSDQYDLETDFYGGYANSFAGFDWYVMPIYYHIWGSDEDDTSANFGVPGAGLDPDVFEVWFDVTRTLSEVPLSPTLHVLYAYSPDYFFSSGDGHYIKGDVTFTLPGDVSLNAGYGYQTVEGGDYGSAAVFGTGGWDYSHYEVGLSKSLVGFDFDLRYHNVSDNDLDDQLITDFLVTKENAEDRIVFTVSRSF